MRSLEEPVLTGRVRDQVVFGVNNRRPRAHRNLVFSKKHILQRGRNLSI